MKLNGLPAKIERYLHQINSWASKGALTAGMVWKHDTGKDAGKQYLPETVGRKLRSLEELGIIAVRDSGVSVEYRWLPPEIRKRYIPYSCRPDGAKDKLFREPEADEIDLI
jgi:hypothetical protein